MPVYGLNYRDERNLALNCIARKAPTDEQIAALGTDEPERPLSSVSTLLALVRAGLGVAFVPEMFVRENTVTGVHFLKLRNPEPYRQVNIMKRRGRQLSPVANRLLKLISER